MLGQSTSSGSEVGPPASGVGGGCSCPAAPALPASLPASVDPQLGCPPPPVTLLPARSPSPFALSSPSAARAPTALRHRHRGRSLNSAVRPPERRLPCLELINLGCVQIPCLPLHLCQESLSYKWYFYMYNLTSNFYLEARNRKRMQPVFCVLGRGGTSASLFATGLENLRLPPSCTKTLFCTLCQ